MDTGEKLLERMRVSKSGWKLRDLDALYVSFGFVLKEGKAHRRYHHPRFPQLYATVARHTALPIGYIQTAIKLIDRLKLLEAQDESSRTDS